MGDATPQTVAGITFLTVDCGLEEDGQFGQDWRNRRNRRQDWEEEGDGFHLLFEEEEGSWMRCINSLLIAYGRTRCGICRGDISTDFVATEEEKD